MPYTASDIARYWKGQMSPGERHALEKSALEDPLLADALEGFRHAADMEGELNSLQAELARKMGGAKVIPLGKQLWWKIAASVVIIGGLGYWGIRSLDRGHSATVADAPVIEKPASVNPENPFVADSNSESKTNSKTVLIDPARSKESLVSSGTAEDTMTTSSVPAEDLNSQPAVAAKNIPDTTSNELDNTGRITENAIKTRDMAKAEEINTEVKKKEIDDKNAAARFNNPANAKKSSPTPDTKSKKQRPINYSGNVVDNNNQPVPYANIQNLGNNRNVLADQNGFFVVPADTDSLVLLNITAQGYNEREFRLNRFDRKKSNLVLYEVTRAEGEAELTVVAELYLRPDFQENLKNNSEAKPENGWNLFNQYIANKILREKEGLIAGEVIVTFSISKSGKPSNIVITRSLSPANNEEVIRLLKEGPDWTPGKKGGDVVVVFRFI